jgi:hypothetical protein
MILSLSSLSRKSGINQQLPLSPGFPPISYLLRFFVVVELGLAAAVAGLASLASFFLPDEDVDAPVFRLFDFPPSS